MATAAAISSRAPGLAIGASSALLVAFAASGIFGSLTVPIRSDQSQYRRAEIGHDSPMMLDLLADVEDTLERLEKLDALDPSLTFVDAPDVLYNRLADWEVVSDRIVDAPAPPYREQDFGAWS